MDPQVLIASALRRTFRGWSKESIARVSALSRLIRVRKGQYLARATDRFSVVWVVMSGSIRVVRQRAGGRHYTINYLEPGHMIGLIPMFDGEGLLADYLAHEDATLAVVPARALLETVRAEPDMAIGLLTLLSQRVRMLHGVLEQHSLMTPARRLAARLLALGSLFGTPVREGVAISLKVSQNDLAVLVGVTRPTINKEINALVEAGILKKTAYRRLVIVDLPALQRLADAD